MKLKLLTSAVLLITLVFSAQVGFSMEAPIDDEGFSARVPNTTGKKGRSSVRGRRGRHVPAEPSVPIEQAQPGDWKALHFQEVGSGISSEPFCFDLTPGGRVFQSYFEHRVEEIIAHKTNSGSTGETPHIRELTPLEAEELFADYVTEKLVELGKVSDIGQSLKEIFSSTYFGESHPLQQRPITAADVIKEKSSYIEQYLLGGDGNFHEGGIVDALADWSLVEIFVSPDDLRREFFIDRARRLSTGVLKPEGDPEAIVCAKYLRDNRVRREANETDNTSEEVLEKRKTLLFSYEIFGLETDATIRRHMGFLTSSLIEDILKGARTVMRKTQRGDILVSFGNTPYFLGAALKNLISLDSAHPNYRQIIVLPFSGAPNSNRQGGVDPKDLVTLNRYKYFVEYLKSCGLSPQDETLHSRTVYFMDVVGSGSGPMFVMEILGRLFKEAAQAVPDMHLILMNEIRLNVIPEERYLKIDPRHKAIAELEMRDGTQAMLSFPSTQDARIKVPAHVVQIPGHLILDMLTHPSTKRMLPEYNAAYWSPYYDQRIKRHQESYYPEMLRAFFDSSIVKMLGEEEVMLVEEAE